MMDDENGLYLKMNPPLRTKGMSEAMTKALMRGDIDFTESDHAPHTLKEKIDPTLDKPFASGVPGQA